MPWTNQDLELFHGCADAALQPVNPVGIGAGGNPHNIQLSLCRPLTDFGRGFYTTTWEHQAKEWANQQTRRLFRARGSTAAAIVLRFQVGRDRLAELEDLVFTRDTTEFYDLVQDCRSGVLPHGRTPANNPRGLVEYDLVYGPVSLWRQKLVIKDCDQISFHTPQALAILPSPDVHARGNPLF